MKIDNDPKLKSKRISSPYLIVTLVLFAGAGFLFLVGPAIKNAYSRSSQLADSGALLIKTKLIAKNAASGTLIYASDFDDVIPYVLSTDAACEVINPYLARDVNNFRSLNPDKSRLVFNLAIAGTRLSDIGDRNQMPEWFDSIPWPSGNRVVGRVDGSAVTIDSIIWPAAVSMLSKTFKRDGKSLPDRLGEGKWNF